MLYHYSVYNANTRYLYLYPEAVILTEEDLADLPKFVEKMSQAPYQMKFSSIRGSGHAFVRLLFVKVDDEAWQLPIACTRQLARLIARMK